MLKIAIVDDDSTIVEGIRHLLIKKIPDITIDHCYTDGNEALEHLRSAPFDLLITDITMGNISGLDLIEKLQNQRTGTPFTSIVISAHQNFHYAKKGIELAIKSYITKPINFPYLIELVQEECLRKSAEKTTKLQQAAFSEPIQQVIAYIRQNYRSNSSLKEAAQDLHYNPAYLGRAFKKETGSTFNDYLATLRMEKAKDLLKNTLLSIDEISMEVGIEHVSYFSTLFKRCTGASPSAYRKK